MNMTVENRDSEFLALRVIQDAQNTAHPTGAPANTQAPPSSDNPIQTLAVKTERMLPTNQREIARSLDMSLGMTNTVLKRLASKGWLSMHRINGRSLAYMLTPDGTRELARRSYRYLRRTIRGVVGWKNRLNHLIGQAKEHGTKRVLLAGASDLDFLIEHLSRSHGLPFESTDCPLSLPTPDSLVLLGESIDPATLANNEYSLRQILADPLYGVH